MPLFARNRSEPVSITARKSWHTHHLDAYPRRSAYDWYLAPTNGARRRRRPSSRSLKVLTTTERCRTAALSDHRDRCSRCGYRAISVNSCRDRHFPKQPGPRTRSAAAGEPPGTLAHLVRPCGLHPSPTARPTGPAEQEDHLQPVVPSLRGDLDGSHHAIEAGQSRVR